MMEWLRALAADEAPVVVVTVAATRGSTPRETGARMLVNASATSGTVGGGHLEHVAIDTARRMLAAGEHRPQLRRYPLGPALGQCCGGVVSLLFESFAGARPDWVQEALVGMREQRAMVLVSGLHPANAGVHLFGADDDPPDSGIDATVCAAASNMIATGTRERRTMPGPGPGRSLPVLLEPIVDGDFDVYLFGAGHVGRALAGVLAWTPCRLTVVDSRIELLDAGWPENVTPRYAREPERTVDEAPAGAFYLVMSHSHPLDLAICERILRRGDFRHLGLIGSISKRRRFEKQLAAAGIGRAELARMRCPIGIDGIPGKQPGEIAVAVAAELLRVRAGCAAGHEPAGTAVASLEVAAG